MQECSNTLFGKHKEQLINFVLGLHEAKQNSKALYSISSGWLGDTVAFWKVGLFCSIYVILSILGRAKVTQHDEIQSSHAGVYPAIPDMCENRAAETIIVKYSIQGGWYLKFVTCSHQN